MLRLFSILQPDFKSSSFLKMQWKAHITEDSDRVDEVAEVAEVYDHAPQEALAIYYEGIDSLQLIEYLWKSRISKIQEAKLALMHPNKKKQMVDKECKKVCELAEARFGIAYGELLMTKSSTLDDLDVCELELFANTFTELEKDFCDPGTIGKFARAFISISTYSPSIQLLQSFISAFTEFVKDELPVDDLSSAFLYFAEHNNFPEAYRMQEPLVRSRHIEDTLSRLTEVVKEKEMALIDEELRECRERRNKLMYVGIAKVLGFSLRLLRGF